MPVEVLVSFRLCCLHRLTQIIAATYSGSTSVDLPRSSSAGVSESRFPVCKASMLPQSLFARFSARSLKDLSLVFVCYARASAIFSHLTSPLGPNQALEPTPPSVTHPADAGCAPAGGVAHL